MTAQLNVMSVDDDEKIVMIRTNCGPSAAELLAKFELGADEVHISCIYLHAEAPKAKGRRALNSESAVYDYVFSSRCGRRVSLPDVDPQSHIRELERVRKTPAPISKPRRTLPTTEEFLRAKRST